MQGIFENSVKADAPNCVPRAVIRSPSSKVTGLGMKTFTLLLGLSSYRNGFGLESWHIEINDDGNNSKKGAQLACEQQSKSCPTSGKT